MPGNHDILFCQLCFQFLHFQVLRVKLCGQVVHHLFQLIGIDATRAQFFFQLTDHFAVMRHGILDKLHILTDRLFGSLRLHVAIIHCDAPFRLVDAAETLLDFVHRAHDFVQFGILVADDLHQRIPFFGQGLFLFACPVVA